MYRQRVVQTHIPPLAADMLLAQHDLNVTVWSSSKRAGDRSQSDLLARLYSSITCMSSGKGTPSLGLNFPI